MRFRRGDERGAALVEFALILPVFMMLVLGMFSGGLAYSTKLSLNGAAREGSRYGATLPLTTATCTGATSVDRWLQCVTDATVQAASGDLGSTKAGRSICVAYISNVAPTTRSMTTTATGSTTSTAPCFTDGQSADARRVQVRVVRTEKLEAMFFSRNLTLTASSITRFEATS